MGTSGPVSREDPATGSGDGTAPSGAASAGQDAPASASTEPPGAGVDAEVAAAETAPLPAPRCPWPWRPIDDGPDRHEESDARRLTGGPSGWRTFGARMRGKSHKANGTNCDDWFEFAGDDHWTFVAVSDGAGSCSLSRVGSQAACEAAVRVLSDRLGHDAALSKLGSVEGILAGGAATVTPAVQLIRAALFAAIDEAAHAVERAAAERQAPLKLLSATLSLVAHRVVETPQGPRSLVVTSQIGDGVIGCVMETGDVKVLCDLDVGEFAGQAYFLTDASRRDPRSLAAGSRALVGPVATIFAMTDGVGDDYLPIDPSLARLSVDLMLSGVLDLPPDVANEVVPDVAPQSVEITAWSVEPSPSSFRLRRANLLEQATGFSCVDLRRRPGLLRRIRDGGDILRLAELPEERLRLWLDGYHVRTSFDDRTLVCVERART